MNHPRLRPVVRVLVLYEPTTSRIRVESPSDDADMVIVALLKALHTSVAQVLGKVGLVAQP